MSYQMTRANQIELLAFVAESTKTYGWKADAVAWAVAEKTADGTPGPALAIGVFENFTGPGRAADFSFAMANGHRMNRGIIEAFLLVAFHPAMLNLDHLWMMAAEENLISQRAMLAIGARFQYRKPSGAGDGSDAIVFLMKRPQGADKPAARASRTEEPDED